jgi:hypothetical protein
MAKSKKLHVIYVPGIRDDIYKVQSTAVKAWRIYGVRGHCHEMPWVGDESYDSKFQRLLNLIDELSAQGDAVCLIGVSAGASAVINAYAERSSVVKAVACVCPKINRPGSVSSRLLGRNPAYKDSLAALQVNLANLTDADKAKITCHFSPADKTVPHRDTVIPGVQEYRLPPFSHFFSILYAVTLGAPKLVLVLRRASKLGRY